MKPIVFATDFSEAARHAGDYSAQLARELKCELILVNVWSLPVMSGETIAFPYSVEELRKTYEGRVKEEAEMLERKWQIKVRAVECMGFMNDELNELCRKEKAAFVVMGMGHGKAEHLLGSAAASFAMHTQTPVMIIPDGANYHRIRRILLASDLVSDRHWHELDMLKELSDRLGASLHILHVSDDLGITAAEHSGDAKQMEKQLGTKAEQWHFASGDVVLEVKEEAEKLHADMIAMVHHQLPWYKKLFHLSSAKVMSFETKKPFIILPEHVTHIA